MAAPQQPKGRVWPGTDHEFPRYDNLESRPDGGILTCCTCLEGTMTKAILKGRVAPDRFKMEKTPKDIGLEFKDIRFPAADGIMISAWEIVDAKNTKLALVNHPLMCTRWGSAKGFDDVPVNFMPMYKHLANAGYNIITYDHRCQGDSEGGLKAFGKLKGPRECAAGVGSEEWKDVIGALDYIEKHETLKSNSLVLVGQCMGSTAMLGVWEREPQRMANVKAFACIMPVIGYNMSARVTRIKVKKNLADVVEKAQWDQFKIAIANPLLGMSQVKCPMFVLQAKEEMYTFNPDTKTNDSAQLFDACPSQTKEILYIGKNTDNPYGKTGKRFEAYGYLNEHPEKFLAFLDLHSKA